MEFNELNMILTASFDKEKTKRNLEQGISLLEKELQSIKISFDVKGVKATLKEMTAVIKKEQEQMEKEISKKTKSVLDVQAPDFGKIKDEIETMMYGIKNLREQFKGLGDNVSVSEVFEEATGKLLGFKVQVEKLKNEMKEVSTFDVKIEDGQYRPVLSNVKETPLNKKTKKDILSEIKAQSNAVKEQIDTYESLGKTLSELESKKFKLTNINESFDITDGGEQLKKVISDYKNLQGESIKIIQVLNQETGELVYAEKRVNDAVQKRLDDQTSKTALLNKLEQERYNLELKKDKITSNPNSSKKINDSLNTDYDEIKAKIKDIADKSGEVTKEERVEMDGLILAYKRKMDIQQQLLNDEIDKESYLIRLEKQRFDLQAKQMSLLKNSSINANTEKNLKVDFEKILKNIDAIKKTDGEITREQKVAMEGYILQYEKLLKGQEKALKNKDAEEKIQIKINNLLEKISGMKNKNAISGDDTDSLRVIEDKLKKFNAKSTDASHELFKIDSDVSAINNRITATEKLEVSFENATIAKNKLLYSLEKMETNNSFVDTTGIGKLREEIELVDINSQDAIKALKNLTFEAGKLGDDANSSKKIYGYKTDIDSLQKKIETQALGDKNYNQTDVGFMIEMFEKLRIGIDENTISVGELERKIKDAKIQVANIMDDGNANKKFNQYFKDSELSQTKLLSTLSELKSTNQYVDVEAFEKLTREIENVDLVAEDAKQTLKELGLEVAKLGVNADQNKKRSNISSNIANLKNKFLTDVEQSGYYDEREVNKMVSAFDQLSNATKEQSSVIGVLEERYNNLKVAVANYGDEALRSKKKSNISNDVETIKNKFLDDVTQSGYYDQGKVASMVDALNALQSATKEEGAIVSDLEEKFKSLKITISGLGDEAKRSQKKSSLGVDIDNVKEKFLFNTEQNGFYPKKDVTETLDALDALKSATKDESTVVGELQEQFKQLTNRIARLGDEAQVYKKLNLDAKNLEETQEKLVRDMEQFSRMNGFAKEKGIEELIEQMKDLDLEAKNATEQMVKLAVKYEELKRNVEHQQKGEQSNNKANRLLSGLRSTVVKNDRFDKRKYEDLTNTLKSLMKAFEMGEIDAGDFKQAIDKLESKCRDFTTEAQQMSGATNSFGDSMKRLFAMVSIYDVIQLGKRAITSMVEEVRSLDAVLVELQKVSNMTGGELQSFTKDMFEASQRLGRTGTELVSAVADFRRSGYDLQDSVMLGENALMLQNIGDGVEGIDEATSIVISSLKGLNLEASDSVKVLDVLNQVSNTCAIGFGDLAEGMKRSSALLHQAGSDVEEIAGMLTAGFVSIQNIERVSTSLNTISLRIRALETGEDMIDGEPIAKLGEELNAVGVAVVDADGKLRDFYDIMNDLGTIYPKLTKEQQQMVTQTVGGARNASVLTAVLQNWDECLKAVNEGLYSNGSAMKENEVFMNSIQGHVNNLTTAWQEFSTKSINSDFVKNIIDLGTGILNLTTSCGGLVTVLGALAIAFIAVKWNVVHAMMWELIITVDKLAKGLITLKKAMIGFGNVSAFLKGGAIVAGVLAIAGAFKYVAESGERARRKIQEINTSLNDTQDKKRKYGELVEQFEQLSKLSKVQGLNNEQQQQFTEIQNELVEIMPEVNGYYDEQGNFIITEEEKLRELVKTYDEYIKLKKEEKALLAKQSVDDTLKSYNNEKELLDSLKKRKDIFEKIKNGMSVDDLAYDEKNIFNRMLESSSIKDPLEASKKAFTDTVGAINESISRMNTHTKDMYSEIIDTVSATDEWRNSTEQQNNAIREFLTKLPTQHLAEYVEQIKEGTFSTEQFIGEALSMSNKYNSLNQITEDFISGNISLTEYMNELEYVSRITGKSVTDLQKEFQNVNTNSVTEEIFDLAKSLEDAEKEFDDFASGINMLDSAMEKLDKGNQLTGDEILSLVNKFPSLRSELIKTEKGYTINKDALVLLRQETVDYEKQTKSSQIEATKIALQQCQKRLKVYLVEVDAINDLASAQKALESKSSSGNSLFGMEYRPASYKESYNAQEKEVLGYVSALVDLYGQLDDIDIVDSGGLGDITNSKDSSKARFAKYIEKGLDDDINAIKAKGDKLAREIETIENKISLASAKGDFEQELALTRELEKSFEKQKDLIHNQANELRGLREKMIGEISKQNISALKGLDLSNVSQKQLSDILRNYDRQIDSANIAGKESTEASLQNQKALVEEYLNALIKVNEEISTLSNDWYTARDNEINKEIEIIQRKYDLEHRLLDEKLTLLELEQILMKEGSAEWMAIEEEKYNLIIGKQKLIMQQIQDLLASGIGMESKHVQELEDLYLQYEQQRLNWIKQRAEQEKKAKLDELKGRLDILKEQETAVKKLHDLAMDMIKAELQAKKDAIQDEINSAREAKDKRIALLREEQNERKYQQDLGEKQKSVDEINKQLEALQFDTSEEANRKRLELKEQLLKAEQDLENLQHDKSIEKQEEALNKEFERFEEEKKKELEVVDQILKEEGKLREEALRQIENGNKAFYDKLIQWNAIYGSGVSNEITSAWETAQGAMNEFGVSSGGVYDVLSSIAQKMKEINAEMKEINENKVLTDFYVDPNKPPVVTPPPTTTIQDTVKKMKENAEAWKKATTQDDKDRLSSENVELGKSIGAFKESNGEWYIMVNGVKKRLFDVYHTGIEKGVIGGRTLLKSNEELIKVAKGEGVFTPKQMDNIWKSLNGEGQSGAMYYTQEINLTVEGNTDTSTLEPLLERWGKVIKTETIKDLTRIHSKAGHKPRTSTLMV